MGKHQYLMESDFEAERLQIKTDSTKTKQQLMDFNFGDLPERARVLDAGSGSGAVAQVILDLAHDLKKKIDLTLFDQSLERMAYSANLLKMHSNVSYETGNLENMQLSDNTYDFIFCRFIFEYLPNQDKVFKELKRILKPGGHLVIGDLDLNCQNHYPMEAESSQQLVEVVELLERTKLIDTQAGRKLYHYYRSNDMMGIRVNLYAHHLFHGTKRRADLINWEQKIINIGKIVEQKKLKISFDFPTFHQKFMAFLNDEASFSYTPLIMLSGTKKWKTR